MKYFIILAIAAVLVWIFRRTIYFVVLTAFGRNRYATVGQMLRVPFHLPNYTRPAQAAKHIRQLQTDSNGYTLWETPLGQLWASKGASSLTEMVAEQMQRTYGVGSQSVKAGDVVLDGGANIGIFCRVAFRLGAAQVIAIEPSPENLKCIRRNCADELAKNKLIIVPAGLWQKETTLWFAVNPVHEEAGKLIDTPADLPLGHTLIEVPVVNVDALKKRLAVNRIDFIKLDIEGAEREALAGAVETLRSDKPRMAICMYHLDDDIDVLPALVTKANPTYKIETGMCLSDGSFWRLRPKILFFR
jgi:FkbM family methyltransferase